MLTLLIGLILLMGGSSGRIALIGSRASTLVAALGALLSIVGLARIFRTLRARHRHPAAEITSQSANMA